MSKNKENTEILVGLKDVAVGLAIILGKERTKASINSDVLQETNCILMLVLKEIAKFLK